MAKDNKDMEKLNHYLGRINENLWYLNKLKVVDIRDAYWYVHDYYQEVNEKGILDKNLAVKGVLTEKAVRNLLEEDVKTITNKYDEDCTGIQEKLTIFGKYVENTIRGHIGKDDELSDKYIELAYKTAHSTVNLTGNYIHPEIREKKEAELNEEIKKLCDAKLGGIIEEISKRFDDIVSKYGVDDCNEQVKLREQRLKKILDEDILAIFEENQHITEIDCELITLPTSNGDVLAIKHENNLYLISQKGYAVIDYTKLEIIDSYDLKGDINSMTDQELLDELFEDSPKSPTSVYGKYLFGLANKVNPKRYPTILLSFVNLTKGLYLAYKTKKKIKERKLYNKIMGKATEKAEKAQKEQEREESLREAKEALARVQRLRGFK